ncbi:MAG: ribosome recycling factor [Deltaproteobacteria bacterium]|nr:ribosome recycling factor [Deltaproteobacteria bacterium]
MPDQYKQFESQCKTAIEHLKKEIGRLRTGRASSALLEGITVEYYGSQVPLIQLGMIATPEPRLITVQVYDGGAVEAVEKAIRQADLGLNPARDGNLIRISIPALTEERRKELIKKLHKLGEECKISLRNHRRDAIDELKKKEKAKEMSSDDLRRGQDEIQKITDRHTSDVDSIMGQKEKEMLEV